MSLIWIASWTLNAVIDSLVQCIEIALCFSTALVPTHWVELFRDAMVVSVVFSQTLPYGSIPDISSKCTEDRCCACSDLRARHTYVADRWSRGRNWNTYFRRCTVDFARCWCCFCRCLAYVLETRFIASLTVTSLLLAAVLSASFVMTYLIHCLMSSALCLPPQYVHVSLCAMAWYSLYVLRYCSNWTSYRFCNLLQCVHIAGTIGTAQDLGYTIEVRAFKFTGVHDWLVQDDVHVSVSTSCSSWRCLMRCTSVQSANCLTSSLLISVGTPEITYALKILSATGGLASAIGSDAVTSRSIKLVIANSRCRSSISPIMSLMVHR